jgi:hypothetical protein
MRSTKRTFVFHPILFALCPLLSLYLINLDIVRIQYFLRDLLIILFISLVIWSSLSLFLKSVVKASILVSAFLFFFFSSRYLLLGIGILSIFFGNYDETFRLIETNKVQIIWYIVCAILITTVMYFLQKKRNLRNISSVLNIISSVWLLAIVIPLLYSYLVDVTKSKQSIGKFNSSWIAKINSEPCSVSVKSKDLPDIYYIILDGYTRDDVLKSIYQVNNEDFLLFLQQQGFYVASNSRSNYKRTTLSLNSSLNFDYIDLLSEETGLDAINTKHLYTVIANNRTFHQLRCLGYKIYSTETGFYYTDIDTADSVYSSKKIPSYFEIILIENTPLITLNFNQPYEWHRERISYALKEITELAHEEGPKFIFAHVISPHPPFVFGVNGEPKNPQILYTMNDGDEFKMFASETEYREGYREQIIYISKLVRDSIQGILHNSARPPIIVIQGDHGPALQYDDNQLEKTNVQERFSILNAYYLPGVQADRILYSSITPVNTFRIIFNTYFGANYPLLDDKSYYSPDNDIYKFIDVTDNIANNLRK